MSLITRHMNITPIIKLKDVVFTEYAQQVSVQKNSGKFKILVPNHPDAPSKIELMILEIEKKIKHNKKPIIYLDETWIEHI